MRKMHCYFLVLVWPFIAPSFFILRFTYEQFYPPSWVGNAELERRHKENGAKARRDLSVLMTYSVEGFFCR